MLGQYKQHVFAFPLDQPVFAALTPCSSQDWWRSLRRFPRQNYLPPRENTPSFVNEVQLQQDTEPKGNRNDLLPYDLWTRTDRSHRSRLSDKQWPIQGTLEYPKWKKKIYVTLHQMARRCASLRHLPRTHCLYLYWLCSSNTLCWSHSCRTHASTFACFPLRKQE